MGRAGAGGGGSGSGGSFGGHSSERMSGGHQVGGGRAGQGSGDFRSSADIPHIFINSRSYRHGGYSNPMYNTGVSSRAGGWITIVVILMILIFSFGFSSSKGKDIPASTVNREKVDTGVAFHNNFIVDELGWFDNIPKTERRLKDFYDKTGIQPYIVLHKYDSSLTTEAEKEAYARDYYSKNIDNEGTFLFMYFAEQDTDNDVGYMCYVNGKQITSVMDSEAIEVFWAYTDNNWYSDMSTDDLFVNIFDKTADRIMDKSTTTKDVLIIIFKVVAIVSVIWGTILVIRVKRKAEKEKAEETERILKTPLRSSDDDLADKYLRR